MKYVLDIGHITITSPPGEMDISMVFCLVGFTVGESLGKITHWTTLPNLLIWTYYWKLWTLARWFPIYIFVQCELIGK